MNNVIIPFSLSAVQERDHLIWDKVARQPMILKRGTYKQSEYDTDRYTVPRSQVMCVYQGKAICAPLNNNGTAMWAQSSFYKITGLTYPATLNISFYKTNASDGLITRTVTGNDAASLATAIKAIDSYIAKTEVLSDGIGVQCNSYNTSDMSNAIYGSMRFRITGDGATKIDATHVSIGDITLQMMDEYVYQCQQQKAIIRKKGVALPPYQAYPWRLVGSNSSGAGFHADKMVQYYSTNGKTSFDASSTMTKAVFDSLAESTVPAQKALWEKYDGDYKTYVSSILMDIEDVRGSNTIYNDIAEFTKVVGSFVTKNYKNEDVPAYPALNKCLTYGFADDEIHAPGNWLSTDWRFMAMIMARTGLTSSNKTEWDNEIRLVGGTPTYAGTTYWLPCCENSASTGLIYYATNGNWATGTKNDSKHVLPFLAFDF